MLSAMILVLKHTVRYSDPGGSRARGRARARA
eukprot:COSAG02_NODE_41846_length_390_cov_0.879725_1_plen_31_part_01